jgi:hypothetical protein
MDVLLRLTQVGAESLEGWCGIVGLDTTSSRSETAVNSFTGMNPGERRCTEQGTFSGEMSLATWVSSTKSGKIGSVLYYAVLPPRCGPVWELRGAAKQTRCKQTRSTDSNHVIYVNLTLTCKQQYSTAAGGQPNCAAVTVAEP